MAAIIVECGGQRSEVIQVVKDYQKPMLLPNFENQTVIVKCDSAFQDNAYGQNKRVASVGKDKATCTTCGRVHVLKKQ